MEKKKCRYTERKTERGRRGREKKKSLNCAAAAAARREKTIRRRRRKNRCRFLVFFSSSFLVVIIIYKYWRYFDNVYLRSLSFGFDFPKVLYVTCK